MIILHVNTSPPNIYRIHYIMHKSICQAFFNYIIFTLDNVEVRYEITDS